MRLRGRVSHLGCTRVTQILLTCWFYFRLATGDCTYEGKHYMKGSIWHPTPCTVCLCDDPVAVCENIVCKDPHCDYSAGQQLQLVENACCPECRLRRQPCQLHGHSVPDSTTWSHTPCVTCVCDDGEVKCWNVTCPPQRCKPGQVQQSLPGQCCPRCIPVGPSCTDQDGVRHLDGSEWSPLPCVLCVCRSGHTKCLPQQCPQPDCALEDLLPPSPGECCMTCRRQTCLDRQHVYQEGDRWTPDSCTACVCTQGITQCRKKDCGPDIDCELGERSVTLPGQCCPTCVPSSGACELETPRRYHGDMWNISDCEFCMCSDGEVQCRTLACRLQQCKQGERLIASDGKCCDECLSVAVCEYNGTIFQDSDTWDPNPCTVCTCRKGKTICYQTICPTCPKGSAPVVHTGRCCGECKQVHCSPACGECLLSDPNYCLGCRDAGHLLQNGLCKDKCEDGFFPALNNTCLACHSTCETCRHGTPFHCLSCPLDLLLKDGQCVSRCDLGFYQEADRCLRCHHFCGSCSGPAVTQCLTCASPHRLLLNGRCVDICNDRHFVQGRYCLECPSSCKKCMPDGPSCSSCHEGAHLHKRQCLLVCPKGYYSDMNSHCQACHPSCAECNGEAASSCTACSEGVSLTKGHCVSPCPTGTFLTSEGTCQDCELGCAACVTMNGEASPVCTHCENILHVAQGVMCQESCAQGMYLRDGICYTCDSGCEACQGPGQCDKCFLPFLLDKGHCIKACGQHSFADFYNVCQTCSQHCLECVSEQACTACDNSTFLSDGICVSACRAGQAHSIQHRKCHAKPFAPSVVVRGQLEVPEKHSVVLPAWLIQVEDVDNDALVDRFTVQLEKLPRNGEIMRVSENQDTLLGEGDMFTLKNLAESRIWFVHHGGLGQRDDIVFRVSDGDLMSDKMHLPVRILPSSFLMVTVNKLFHAVIGSRTTLSRDMLDFRSNIQEPIEICVVSGPIYGSFWHYGKRKQVSVFHLSDLHMEEVMYSHHSSSSSRLTDMAVLIVSSSFQQISIILSIKLQHKNTLMPVVLANAGGQVWPGEKMLISRDILEVKAMDPKSSAIVYTLNPTVNNPKKGEIMMIVPVPEEGVHRRWEVMSDGTMGVKTFRFMQKDINEGRIFYRHQGPHQEDSDFFTFEVSDMASPPNVLHNQTFNIRILQGIQDDTSALSAHSSSPGTQFGMTVLENQVVPITRANLPHHNKVISDHDLVYRLTSLLGDEEGAVEHIDYPYVPVLRFTQADINNNRIIYRPPDQEMGLQAKDVSFTFVLSDGKESRQSPEQRFTIHITPVNNMPPRFIHPDPEVTAAKGDITPLGLELLAVLDLDTQPENLTITLVEEPTIGNLEKIDRQLNLHVLHTGDAFPYTEFATSTFQYRHSGQDGSQKDHIKLSASDGVFRAVTTITVHIIKVDKSPPVLLSSSLLQINVSEGGTSTITRNHLAFFDSDDTDDDVAITLVNETAQGYLLNEKQGRSVSMGMNFTQADINGGHIRYVADGEIGNKSLKEVLYFSVSDASQNVLPSQVLSVLITPVDNQPPVVHLGPAVEIEEGGEAQITAAVVSFMDVDTPLTDLFIVVGTMPNFGSLHNRKPDSAVSELSSGDAAYQFTVTDIVNGHLFYIQSDHLNKEPIEDSFLFYATDGLNKSPVNKFNIHISLINDEPPTMVTEQLFVKEGQAVTLTNASVYVMDLDTEPQDLQLVLMLPPSSGTLKRKNSAEDTILEAIEIKQNSSFTYKDLLNGLIIYEHNDEETTTDMLILHVTDGNFNDTRQVNIIIGLIQDETPRVTVNTGLRIRAGSKTTIRSSDLRATDVDSEDSAIIYTLTKNPIAGSLHYHNRAGQKHPITKEGPHSTFTQEDIDKGHIEYMHEVGEMTGTLLFKFKLSDTEGNELIDQDFFITVMEDRLPPKEIANKEFILKEGERKKVTTDFLSFTDVDSEPGALVYQVLEGPHLGHLELTLQPGNTVVAWTADLLLKAPGTTRQSQRKGSSLFFGADDTMLGTRPTFAPETSGVPVVQFTQADLASGSVFYVHTSSDEIYMDKFVFSVTDGSNELVQTFHITFIPVDDVIPAVINNGLRVQEGVRKLLTEFDLKAVDLDTEEDKIIFTIIEAPIHGTLDLQRNNKDYIQTARFAMADIYENRVSYLHNGNEMFSDTFTFTVTDGTNDLFTLQNKQDPGTPSKPVSSPQEFHIEIVPVDDGTPVLQINHGLEFLEQFGSVAGNYITEFDLKAVDEDSLPQDIIFSVIKMPEHGIIENTDHPGQNISRFTQEDINRGKIRYKLTEKAADLQDMFHFDLMDRKPNVVADNIFHIRWSEISFETSAVNVTETAGMIQVPVVRKGNLKQYSIIQCQTKPDSAVSMPETAQPGMYDFVQFSGQVQFDSWQEAKMCSMIINDDSVYEGPESFYVELSSPNYALLGDIGTALVTIIDVEDVTMIEFEDGLITVNETDDYIVATIKRKGDLSTTVSVLCSTFPVTATGSSLTGLESGSDYISRGVSDLFRVVFTPGIASTRCDVKLLDDSDYEGEERFELRLLDPSPPATLGPISSSIVVIRGPNDESRVYLSATEYHFAEDEGVVEVEVLREGSDLNYVSSVWCATRLSNPPSATPGVDYVSSSSQITFSPGQVSKKCQLTVLDDDFDPHLEGNETFEIFLSSAVGTSLAKPYHSIVFIEDDMLDMPWFTFTQDTYVVDEKNRSVNASVLRLGDLTMPASVICYTRQKTAKAVMDYIERAFDNSSRIFFKPGEREKNCSVEIEDDTDFEPEEDFFLKLAEPMSSAKYEAQLGEMDAVRVIITNTDDVPKLQFDRPAYSVHEPSIKQQIATVVVRIIRTGAENLTSSVRCSTRDGSALSGLDYNARSLFVTFPPGIHEVEFPVDILYNSDVEWHETFTVLLGPEKPQGAMFGSITMATITILDNEVSGSLVLPAQPVVVSLLHYDDAEQGAKIELSAGYPIVCINPCDIHHPNYSITHTLCEDSGINSSAIAYQWEVAAPQEPDGSTSPFVLLSDSTLFTSTNHMVLDSIHFRPHFRIRCLAQPLHANGSPGIPLKSQPRVISHTNAICKSPSFGEEVQGYHAQSFLASLSYVPPDAARHANTIHIRVEIPHQDGMLPLVSTFPLHNVRFLLLEPVYRQQHVCSNLLTAAEHASIVGQGFLGEFASDDEQLPFGPGYDFPYQFDNELREDKTLLLYRHLNLKQCIWIFDAWYHMTELVDICGGHVLSDFKLKDQKKTHLTVRVPLHVSYLFAMVPVGWSSLEHYTDMEFAFYYDAVLWKSGLETEGRHGGKLQIRRVLIGQDGKLVLEFRTQAKFRGQFVLFHQTMPGYESRVIAPKSLAISFDLQQIWSQPTFDSPHQMWQATSRFNLKDYTGMYVIEMIPCSVTPTQVYINTYPLPCIAQQPQRFEVPLSFQQTNRPVPVIYSLDTQLQLTNNLEMMLQDPSTDTTLPEDWDFNGAFSRGQNLYGRVLWNPSQDLRSAYRLSVEKVYLCTGSNGHVPTYDPSGEVYIEGPQYGCLQPSSKLLYRFLILDRENPDIAQADFRDIPFLAQFASGSQELSPLLDMPGVDGFVFNVEPLYKVDSGHQWYLQVVYFITPDTPYLRFRRAAVTSLTTVGFTSYHEPHPNVAYDMKRNGTNIQRIILKQESPQTPSVTPLLAILPAIFFPLLISVIIIILCVRKRRRKKLTLATAPAKRNNLTLSRPSLGVSVTSLASSVSKQNLNRLSSGAEKTINLAAKYTFIKPKDVNVNSNTVYGTEV